MPASLRPEEDGKFETYAGLVASNHDRTFEHREMTAAWLEDPR
jgi:hypothetical protein